MPPPGPSNALVSTMGWPELRNLWSDINASTATGWADGKALEDLVLRAFSLDKVTITWPFDVRLDGVVVEQVDGVLHLGTRSFLLECKDTASPVNATPIQKLSAQVQRRPPGTMGLIVSRSGFTDPAVTIAQFMSPQLVLLCSGVDLGVMLEEERPSELLRAKYRACVERALPDYDLRAETL